MFESTQSVNNYWMKFGDIQKSQGRGKGYQPKPLASADNHTKTLMILVIAKTESNNFFHRTLNQKKKGHDGRWN